jgi:hypothetical protein
MTAVTWPELRLMLNATKAMVQHGKGLALACLTDMKAAHQPHSKKKLKAL